MGKIEVKKYLEDFEKSNLPRNRQGVFVVDGINVTPHNFAKTPSEIHKNGIVQLSMGGKRAYGKVFTVYPFDLYDNGWNKGCITECVTGKALNDLGVNSIMSYPIDISCVKRTDTGYGTVSQDLCSLDELLCAIGTDINPILDIDFRKLINRQLSKQKRDTWKILLNPRVKRKMLEVMTLDCYNDFVNMYIADTMLGSLDRHSGNYFFVKNKGSKLWESVIALDNEYTLAYKSMDYYGSEIRTSKDLANHVITSTTLSQNPQNVCSNVSYLERVKILRKLVEQGKFDKPQEELITRIIDYDLPTTMRKFYSKYNIRHDEAIKLYDISSYIWEAGRENLR